MSDEQEPGQCHLSSDRVTPVHPTGVFAFGLSSLGAGSVPVPCATARAGGDGPVFILRGSTNGSQAYD